MKCSLANFTYSRHFSEYESDVEKIEAFDLKAASNKQIDYLNYLVCSRFGAVAHVSHAKIIKFLNVWFVDKQQASILIREIEAIKTYDLESESWFHEHNRLTVNALRLLAQLDEKSLNKYLKQLYVGGIKKLEDKDNYLKIDYHKIDFPKVEAIGKIILKHSYDYREVKE